MRKCKTLYTESVLWKNAVHPASSNDVPLVSSSCCSLTTEQLFLKTPPGMMHRKYVISTEKINFIKLYSSRHLDVTSYFMKGCKKVRYSHKQWWTLKNKLSARWSANMSFRTRHGVSRSCSCNWIKKAMLFTKTYPLMSIVLNQTKKYLKLQK